MHAFPRWRLAAALPLVASLAAQAAPPGDPLNPDAPVPPASHASSLAHYRPAGETEVAPWKATNDTVGRIGGWRAYAREASAPPASAAPASAASGAAGGHDHSHGGSPR
jgi:hypothetical protein